MANDESKKEILRRGLEALDAIEQQFKVEKLFRHIEELDTPSEEEKFLDQLSELFKEDLKEETGSGRPVAAAARLGSLSEKPLAHRIEELKRGVITSFAFVVAEFKKQSWQAEPASGFRRSEVQFRDGPDATNLESSDLPDVVNWVPGPFSSKFVGFKFRLDWKGRDEPSARPALKVIYDDEPVPFETTMKDARSIEISVDQPLQEPFRGMIEITEDGEYVVNLYSS